LTRKYPLKQEQKTLGFQELFKKSISEGFKPSFWDTGLSRVKVP
jgi:hypothetical protein